MEFLLGAVLGAAGAGFAALAWVEQKANRKIDRPAALPVGAYESVRTIEHSSTDLTTLDEPLGERPHLPKDY
jgi:hypothetical protein